MSKEPLKVRLHFHHIISQFEGRLILILIKVYLNCVQVDKLETRLLLKLEENWISEVWCLNKKMSSGMCLHKAKQILDLTPILFNLLFFFIVASQTLLVQSHALLIRCLSWRSLWSR